MRSSFVTNTGLKLTRSPSARQQAVRLRLAVIGGIVLMALAGVAAGVLTAPPTPAAATGPFSYFPS